MPVKNISSDSLKPGMKVKVNPQSDMTRKLLVEGIISEILTKTISHPHGILVMLTNGEKGRVKEIVAKNAMQQTFLPNLATGTVAEIIEKGEGHYSEFKSSALWSLRLSGEDIKQAKSPEVKQYGRNASKVILAKTLAGFLNTDGGYLIIGVKENKDGGADEIVGVESEYFELPDKCDDGYRRMIIDSVIKPYLPSKIFNHINDYLKITFERMGGNTVCAIGASKSDVRVFITLNNTDKFFIRVDSSTREINGEEIVDYCDKRFR